MKGQKQLALLLLEGIYNMLMAEFRMDGSIVRAYLETQKRIRELPEEPHE